MSRLEQPDDVIGRQASLVFRTVHIDKAGETFSDCVVAGEIVAVEDALLAVIVTAGGMHLRFAVADLHPLEGEDRLVGGQELTRDFHNAADPVRLRVLGRDEAVSMIDECRGDSD